MIQWLKGKGIGFMLWICPWAVGTMADEAIANGWTVEENPFMTPIEAKLLDLTNPDTVAWWQGYLKERMADGLVGFKLDRSDEKNPDGRNVRGRYPDGRTYREVHNAYPYLYAKAVGETIDQMDKVVGSGGYPYQPYYDEPLIAVWILYANLHHDLADYLCAQVRAAHEQGTPIVRAMALMHPERAEYRDLFEQYYLGPDLIAAPIWQKGLVKKDVQIPPGERANGSTRGPARRSWPNPSSPSTPPEHLIPLYYRKGSGLDAVLGDLNARWAGAQAKAKNRPDLAELQKSVK